MRFGEYGEQAIAQIRRQGQLCGETLNEIPTFGDERIVRFEATALLYTNMGHALQALGEDAPEGGAALSQTQVEKARTSSNARRTTGSQV